MSRIGKKSIIIPENVEVKLEEKGENEAPLMKIKGVQGEIEAKLPAGFNFQIAKNEINILPKKKLTKKNRALWGTLRAFLYNYIQEGVVKKFEKKLELVGIGYRASLKDKKTLQLGLGYSHDIEIKIPDNLDVLIEKNIVTISGIDKQKVGEFAAKIKTLQPPEPYKGKGIRYFGEKIKIKEGKKAITTTG